MRDKRWAWIVVYLLATAVLAAGVIVLVRDQAASSDDDASAVAKLPDLAPMPFPTDLSVFGSPTGTVGSRVALTASGYGAHRVARIDLYDGARRVQSVVPPKGRSSAPVTFPALAAGSHLLHAQVTDSKGAQALSPPVRVDISVAATASDVPVEVTADAGETPEELAARLGVEPGAVIAFAPGAAADTTSIPPSEPIPDGSEVTVVVPGDNGVDALESDHAIVTNPLPPAVPASGPGADTTAPMKLTGKASGCGVSLTVKRSDGPVFFFDQNAGVPGWASVGETAGDGTLELPAPAPGEHVYFARTDTRKTEPVAVTVPFSCSDETGWTGNTTLIGGILRHPAVKEYSTYLLLSVDGKPWQRIPGSQGESFAIGRGTVDDISANLPALAGKQLTLELWERTEYLTNLVGSGKLVVPDGHTMADVIGEPNTLRLTVKGGRPPGSLYDLQMDDVDERLTFKWQAASSRVDEVMWQVLSVKISTDDTQLTPPNLLAAGTSARTTPDDTGLGGAGSFQIDTAKIPGHENVSAGLADDTPAAAAGTPNLVALTSPIGTGGVAKLDKGAYAQELSDATSANLGRAFQLPVDLPGEGEMIYVRVVANPKGPAVASASPTLAIQLPKVQSIEDLGSVTFTVDSVTADFGRAPNTTLANCVDITVPWNGPGPDPKSSASPWSLSPMGSWSAGDQSSAVETSLKAFYPVSGTYCLSDFPPPDPDCDSFLCDLYHGAIDAFEAVGGIVGQLYDLVAYAYNGVISGVVYAIANFNPVCVALKEASAKAGKGCSSVVGIAAKAVVTAVLAAYGLPPSLPRKGELADLATGDLEVIAVELMKQYGVPCDDIASSPEVAQAVDGAGKALGATDGGDAKAIEDPCQALVHLFVKQTKAQIEATAATSVSQAAGLPNGAGIEGFTMVPAKKGIPEPATVRVTMHPTNPNSNGTGAVCLVELRDSPFSDKDGNGYYQLYTKLFVTEDAPVDGKGTWSGVAYVKANIGLAGYEAHASNAEVTLHGRRIHPSTCTHNDLEVSGRIGPSQPR